MEFARFGYSCAIQRRVLIIAALFRINHLLIGMNVVGKIPVCVGTLRCQAICIYGGVNSPGMYFRQRKVFVHEGHAVAILFQQIWKQDVMRLRTIGAFQIVEIDEHDFGVGVSSDGPSLNVDFVDYVLIGILGEVHLGHADQSFLVLGKQEFVFLVPPLSGERNFNRIVVRKLAGVWRGNDDLHVGGYVVLGAKLPLDPLIKFSRSKLRRTPETDQ